MTSGQNGHRVMTMESARRTIAVGEFKAQCLGLLDQVARNREILVITKRGKPLAKVVPVEEVEGASLEGSVRYHGDIVEPIEEDWDADQ